MRTRILTVGLVALALTAGACVEPFSGSHMTFALSSEVRSPCDVLARYSLTGPKTCSGRPADDRFLYHYEIWATLRRSGVVQLAPITVQRALMNDAAAPDDVNRYELFQLEKEGAILASGRPLKIGDERYFSELSPAEQDETRIRMKLTGGKLAITSYAEKIYQDPGAKRLDPLFYVGYHNQLTRPLGGIFYGVVETYHPYGSSKISGAELKLAQRLDEIDSIWVTIESDPPTRPDPKPSALVYLRGTARQTTRGVVNVEATSPWDPTVTAAFAVMTGLGEEEYF